MAFLAAAFPTASAAASESAGEMAERVVQSAHDDGAPEASALLAELVPFGAGGVDSLLARADADDPAGTRRLVRTALEALPTAAVAWFSSPDHRPDERASVAAATLQVVRELGSAGDLAPAIAVAAGAVEGAPSRVLLGRLEGAVERVLRRDSGGFPKLRRTYASAPRGLHIALVRAIGNTLSDEGLDLLVDLLGSSDLDLPILSQISRTAAALGPLRQERSSLQVRSYLRSASPELRRESALAVGRLNDGDAVADLIPMLEDDERGVRENAHWALQQLTGIGRAADPAVWQRWYTGEMAWWEDEAPELLARLDRIELLSDSEIVASINDLGGHRLFREDLAKRLFGALAHRDPRVVRMACVALQQFEAHSAIPELIQLLNHRDRTVQHQAWTALKAITGRNLPLQRAAWQRGLS